MKIAIYTLTRDRLEYTRHCLKTLEEKAGFPYDHFIVDNGSKDGTREWLVERMYRHLTLLPENAGISKGSNMALEEILKYDYDVIIKMDNDCEIVTPNILTKVAALYDHLQHLNFNIVLSPYVNGINKQPNRSFFINQAGWKIGITGIIGGLFHIVPAKVYREYRYPEQLPKAWGQDDHFCEWLRQKDIMKGYIEELLINHYETTNGQSKRYPEYFQRKWTEEKQQ